MRLERTGRKKKELKNLKKRGGIWYFKKIVGGRVESVSLQTGDLEVAKARRDKLALKMVQEKWEEIDQVRTKRNLATIGEVCARFESATDLQLNPKTTADYVWALKHLIKRARPGTVNVENLPCTILDAGLVREFQKQCLAAVPAGERLMADTAAVSANSILRQARSVFSRRALKRNVYEGLVLPKLDGFLTAPMLNTLKRDTYVKPDEELLKRVWKGAYMLRDGVALVGKTDPPSRERYGGQGGTELHGPPWKRPVLWVIFWLASQTGLRKNELMCMRARWFQGQAGPAPTIRTMFEADFVPKGKRERLVPIAPGVAEEWLRVAKENGWSTDPEAHVLPGGRWQKDEMFKEFGAWMKEQGWTRRQKAHELRKIFASDLTEAGDPYDTQQALGHQDIKTTMRYAARRKVASVDLAARYGPTLTVIQGGLERSEAPSGAATGTEG